MIEKRQYVRMNTVFPVELEILSPSGQKVSRRLLQAFTRDVSEGGMCLEIKSFGAETEKQFLIPDVQFDLTINPTFSHDPIKAIARIVWLRKQDKTSPPRYFIGVQYTDIDLRSRERLIRYAKRLLWIPRLTLAAGVAMAILIVALFWREEILVLENKALVRQLVEGAEKKSDVSSRLY